MTDSNTLSLLMSFITLMQIDALMPYSFDFSYRALLVSSMPDRIVSHSCTSPGQFRLCHVHGNPVCCQVDCVVVQITVILYRYIRQPLLVLKLNLPEYPETVPEKSHHCQPAVPLLNLDCGFTAASFLLFPLENQHTQHCDHSGNYDNDDQTAEPSTHFSS